MSTCWTKRCLDSWWNTISKTVCEGVSGRYQHLLQDTEERDPPSPMWAGLMQSAGSLNGTKQWKKGHFTLFSWAGTSIFSCLRTLEFWFSRIQILEVALVATDFQAFDLRLEVTHWVPLGSRAFGLHFSCISNFSGSPAYREKIVGPVRFQNIVSQCPLYLYILYVFCVSGKCWLTNTLHGKSSW